jgi:hypothetical protein
VRAGAPPRDRCCPPIQAHSALDAFPIARYAGQGAESVECRPPVRHLPPRSSPLLASLPSTRTVTSGPDCEIPAMSAFAHVVTSVVPLRACRHSDPAGRSSRCRSPCALDPELRTYRGAGQAGPDPQPESGTVSAARSMGSGNAGQPQGSECAGRSYTRTPSVRQTMHFHSTAPGGRMTAPKPRKRHHDVGGRDR